MRIQKINDMNFKSNVYDFITNPTPNETLTKKHLDSQLRKNIPDDNQGRTVIEYINGKGLDVCYSRPYITQIRGGYYKNNPIENIKDGCIQLDLIHRSYKDEFTYMPTNNGTVGIYNENDNIEFDDIKKTCSKMTNRFKYCYAMLATIFVAIIAWLCFSVMSVMKAEKGRTIPQKGNIELIKNTNIQNLTKNSLELVGKRIKF